MLLSFRCTSFSTSNLYISEWVFVVNLLSTYVRCLLVIDHCFIWVSAIIIAKTERSCWLNMEVIVGGS